MTKKSKIDDIDRGKFDKKNEFEYSKISEKGLNEDIVKLISAEKNEPDWMLEKRLEGMRLFLSKKILYGVLIYQKLI